MQKKKEDKLIEGIIYKVKKTSAAASQFDIEKIS